MRVQKWYASNYISLFSFAFSFLKLDCTAIFYKYEFGGKNQQNT
jgi:hypothetical protein